MLKFALEDNKTKLNSLPDHKILALSKLKAFADHNFNTTQNGANFL